MVAEARRGEPTPPIAIAGGAAAASVRFGDAVTVPDGVLTRLASACAQVTTDAAACAEHGRDWWPLGIQWGHDGAVPARPAVIVRPSTAEEVAAVLTVCDQSRIPVTAAGGRSGVCGGQIPVHGGVTLDLTGLAGIRDVDSTSMVIDVGPGTFGDVLEDDLGRDHGLTVGHWPQSIALSTVGGWLACRGAGQMSNRYGKIEDIAVGLDVVLADGRTVSTGGHARAAVGPDLDQLFIGSEGTLGVITGARLRVRPSPGPAISAAFGFDTFAAANDACRRVLQRGAAPAILRTYDPAEADRSFGTGGGAVLIARDEGDPALITAAMDVLADECRTAAALDTELVDRWWDHRNDVSSLEALITRGYVVDTMEMTARWADLATVHRDVCTALLGVEHVAVATAHQSHAYVDGACLYFTFAAEPPHDRRDDVYVAAWTAGTTAALAAGASLSHHHGVGLNRARFVRDALGPAFDVLVAAKRALDPNGILNPGKLGLPDPFGEVHWP